MQAIEHIVKNNQLQSAAVMAQLAVAHRYLGELKGLAQTIPNPAILVNTLGIQEAQDSSAIENIITTQDEIYKYLLQPPAPPQKIAAKEVTNYAQALHFLSRQQQQKNLITINMIEWAQKIIVGNQAGIRTQAGTKIVNETTGKVVYTPPPPNQLPRLLKNLERFINDTEQAPQLDPLIKMAIIHHQFESIHPFYDGNGRIGRIINIIYLVQNNLIDKPVLYLSRYINHNKAAYYHLLQTVRDESTWQQWILYMLKGVAKTAQSTIRLVTDIKALQQHYKNEIRNNHPKIYSHELINSIFIHPYTKIALLEADLAVSRLTASRYLGKLVDSGLLAQQKLGKENYYFNVGLINLLETADDLSNEQ